MIRPTRPRRSTIQIGTSISCDRPWSVGLTIYGVTAANAAAVSDQLPDIIAGLWDARTRMLGLMNDADRAEPGTPYVRRGVYEHDPWVISVEVGYAHCIAPEDWAVLARDISKDLADYLAGFIRPGAALARSGAQQRRCLVDCLAAPVGGSHG